jgi:nitroreductase
MDTFECISKRASVREYKAQPISQQVLTQLVDAGRRAPTARGIEPWKFVVVTEKEVLQKLAELANTGVFIKDSASCVVVFCQDTKYYLEDGCAATENILLAACSLGLGACWVAGDKKPYTEDIKKLLNAPADLKLISLIALGWPKKEIPQNKKRRLNEVIHWQKF